MPIPNGGLITETNRQYYEGAQSFNCDGNTKTFLTTFNTDLVYGSSDSGNPNYGLNNFKLYSSLTGGPDSFEEIIGGWSIVGNTIKLDNAPAANTIIVAQLKRLDGGKYGNPLDPGSFAYGNTVEKNYGGYAYISLSDVVNNFLIAYVGNGKLISSVNRTDLLFHSKRAMQEFSYDTLKVVKSQELNVPPNLSVALPQDYVNYVKMSWVDRSGIKHVIYPTRLTSNPGEMPVQDTRGVEIQDQFNSNIDSTSITEERWDTDAIQNLKETFIESYIGINGTSSWNINYGRRYGMDPQYANFNGTFTINDREGTVDFSSDLIGALIILEYISDGLAYDLDTRVPKMAEEAIYAYMLHAVISTRANQPEYIVQRLKQEKFAKLRNAKIRLSNIKLEEITQVLRGQSKWIKH